MSRFRMTTCGAMVVASDTHIGKWIEESGRLDHDQYLLPKLVPLIPEGGTVIDAGALYGDHTLAYAKAVGPHGEVFAFEPNPEAYACLKKNMEAFGMASRVTCCQVGLSNEFNAVRFATDANTGASRVVSQGDKMVPVIPLDEMSIDNVAFIKMDIEGYETRALEGAKTTILRFRPIIVVEVNEGALKGQGASVRGLYEELWALDYRLEVIQRPDMKPEDCLMPQFDVIAYPVT